ncbi:MAG: hypothetical protein ACIAQU_04350 [Phycisphaerales bacterium JB064]
MPGIRLDNFADFALATDAAVMTGPDKIINDLSRYHTYNFFRIWNRHKKIGGGNGIEDYIELKPINTGQWVNSGHTFNVTSTDGLVKHQVNWARYANYLTWDKDEVEMNEGPEAKAKTYKKVYKSKRMRVRENTASDLETALWADPTNEMELPTGTTAVAPTTPRQMYSIPALITNDGLAPSAFTTSGTVQGIDPSNPDYVNWRNQFYSLANWESELEAALFEMKHMSKWEKSGGPADEVMTGTSVENVECYCDFKTLDTIRRILLARNDSLAYLGQRDDTLRYMNVKFNWAEPLGGPTTTETEQQIFGVNWDYLMPTCRKDYFMKLFGMDNGGPFVPWDTPLQRVLYEFTDVQLFLASRRRHFKIFHQDAA